MTLIEYLDSHFEKNIKSDNQKKEYRYIVEELNKYYEAACKKEYKGVSVTFCEVSTINKINFSDNYSYWLYDKTTNLFFNNIHAKHEEFRRCLLLLDLVVNKWDESYTSKIKDLKDNLRLDLEGIYTSIGLGFFATGAMTFGSGNRSRIICSEDFKIHEHSYLRNYMPELSFISVEEAKSELNNILRNITE